MILNRGVNTNGCHGCRQKDNLKNVGVKREEIILIATGEYLEKGMAIHSSILAWRIPWAEDPGGPQSMGSQRVGHD